MGYIGRVELSGWLGWPIRVRDGGKEIEHCLSQRKIKNHPISCVLTSTLNMETAGS
jgi:hypothetical protein